MKSECYKCKSVNIYHEEDGIWCFDCEKFYFNKENNYVMAPTIENLINSMINQLEEKGFTVSKIKYIDEDGKLIEIKNNP